MTTAVRPEISCATPTPSRRGIRTSRRTTSGATWRTTCRAVSPSQASPATWMSSAWFSRLRTPIRTIELSSTTTTRIGSGRCAASLIRAHPRRNRPPDRGARTGPGLQGHGPPQLVGAFAHAPDPEVPVALLAGDDGRVETVAVVHDLELDDVAHAAQQHVDVRRPGVLGHVVQRLPA